MPQQHTILSYKYDELSEDAKEKAREWYRGVIDSHDYADFVVDDLSEICQLMGIELLNVYWTGFYNQGDGACFEAYLDYKAGAVEAVKKYAPMDKELHRIVKNWQKAQAKHFYQIFGKVIHRGHYCHEYCTEFRFEHKEHGSYYNGLDVDTEQELIEPIRDLMRWFYDRLKGEYEYVVSDDHVEESIRIGEYDFTEYGDLFR